MRGPPKARKRTEVSATTDFPTIRGRVPPVKREDAACRLAVPLGRACLARAIPDRIDFRSIWCVLRGVHSCRADPQAGKRAEKPPQEGVSRRIFKNWPG